MRPMYTMSVVWGSPAAQMDSSSCTCPAARECPVRKRTLVATPRCVMGIPSSAQMPAPAVTPASRHVGR